VTETATPDYGCVTYNLPTQSHHPSYRIQPTTCTECAPNITKYLRRACFSPVKSTWLKAIAAVYLNTLPRLTVVLVCKHFTISIATGACLKTLKSQFSHKQKSTILIYADVLKQFNRVLGNLTGAIKMPAGAHWVILLS
jgi:hypothetical protein